MKKVTNNKKMLEAVKKAKKGETIIFDESGNIFGLDFIINKTSKRECLLCKTNLDKDIGEGKWHIPLCKKHRLEDAKRFFESNWRRRIMTKQEFRDENGIRE